MTCTNEAHSVYFFQVYIAEIAPAEYRGTLGSANQLGVTVGGLLGYGLGAGLKWHWLAIAGAVPSTIMVMLMMRFPETPRWLIKNGRISEARRVLVFLRNTSYEKCENECKEIQDTIGLFYSMILLLLDIEIFEEDNDSRQLQFWQTNIFQNIYDNAIQKISTILQICSY